MQRDELGLGASGEQKTWLFGLRRSYRCKRLELVYPQLSAELGAPVGTAHVRDQ